MILFWLTRCLYSCLTPSHFRSKINRTTTSCFCSPTNSPKPKTHFIDIINEKKKQQILQKTELQMFDLFIWKMTKKINGLWGWLVLSFFWSTNRLITRSLRRQTERLPQKTTTPRGPCDMCFVTCSSWTVKSVTTPTALTCLWTCVNRSVYADTRCCTACIESHTHTHTSYGVHLAP